MSGILSPFLVLVFMLAPAAAWLVFAIRGHRRYWGWLSTPFFYMVIVYSYFSFADLDAEVRALYVRIGLIAIGAVHTALPLLVLRDRIRHERK